MKITHITLDATSDGYDIIFIDDDKLMEGDYYHEKVSEKIKGIMEFLDLRNEKYSYEHLSFDLKNSDKTLGDYDYQPSIDEKPASFIKRIKKFMMEV